MSIETQDIVSVADCESPLRVGRGFQLFRYASFEQARGLREQWDAFVERFGGDLFMSYDWCTTWWDHFGHGRQLELYIASSHDELVGVLPLFRETIRWGPLWLRVIRIVGCDHCTTTCGIAIHPDKLEPITKSLMAELERGGRWDVIHLGELPGYFERGQAVANALRRCRQAGEVVFGINDYPHMVFDLPNSFEAYLASLTLKERRNVRRDERRLDGQGNVECRLPVNPSELDQAFSELIELHTSHWAERGRLGHFHEWPNIEAFHRQVAQCLLERGRLAFVEVLVNGVLVASEYGGQFGRRVHWITGCRRREVTSRIGFCALVRLALDNNATQIDALPGHYDYKRRLGARVVGVKTITVHSRHMLARARTRLFRATTWIIGLVYHRIWFWHLAPWVRTRLPHLGNWLGRGSLWPPFIRARFLVAARRARPLKSGRDTP